MERGGEEKEVEGSTSTNVVVNDVIDTIKHVDNNYAIAEAVVVRFSPSYVTDRCNTWCGSNGLG